MGIDNYLEEIKEEVRSLDDEEIKDVRDRVALMESIMVAQDKHMERLQNRIKTLELRVKELEEEEDNTWK